MKSQIETEYSTKLLEIKLKLETEKKGLLSFIANEFRQYFDPQDIINDHSIKKLLSKTKESLDKLTKSDLSIRSLIKANINQLTEDAVAQYVLGNKKY